MGFLGVEDAVDGGPPQTLGAVQVEGGCPRTSTTRSPALILPVQVCVMSLLFVELSDIEQTFCNFSAINQKKICTARKEESRQKQQPEARKKRQKGMGTEKKPRQEAHRREQATGRRREDNKKERARKK